MRNDFSHALRRVWPAPAVCLLIVGCGPRANAPTDAPTAKEALTAALESWKAGQPPTALRKRTPAIVAVDEAWEKGEKLESFESVAGDVDDGVNLHCPVKLALVDERGGRRIEQVTYIVGTAPVITIFRDVSPTY